MAPSLCRTRCSTGSRSSSTRVSSMWFVSIRISSRFARNATLRLLRGVQLVNMGSFPGRETSSGSIVEKGAGNHRERARSELGHSVRHALTSGSGCPVSPRPAGRRPSGAIGMIRLSNDDLKATMPAEPLELRPSGVFPFFVLNQVTAGPAAVNHPEDFRRCRNRRSCLPRC